MRAVLIERLAASREVAAGSVPKVRGLCTAVAAVLAVSGCSQGQGTSDRYDARYGVSASERVIASGPVPKGGGRYKIGNPYSVAGRWYVPREEPHYDQVGIASWYGDEFHGRKTANGEIFDREALTAAHPTLPIPSYVTVTNLGNGRTILVRVNDRGPYAHDRVLDLSRRSAQALGFAYHGTARVRVRYAGRAPLDGNDLRERQFLAGQPWVNETGRYAAASPASPPVRAAPPAGAWQPAPSSPPGGWSVQGYRSSMGGQRQSLGAMP